MKTTIRLLTLLLAAHFAGAQITGAKITFERRTNLYKKFRHNRNIERWVKEDEKTKTDLFELYVTDTFSVFRPLESELKDNLSWATSRNTVYQDFNRNEAYLIKPIWGEELHLTDSLRKRTWKITGGTRKIAGYLCRKAMWQPSDTVRIYAWFSYDIVPSTGPETFNGLPGTILGLATEDGGVVYFAKKVELLTPDAEVLAKPKKKKIWTLPDLKARLEKQYAHEEWFGRMMYEQFGLW